MLAVEQEHQRRHLAAELRRDLANWQPPAGVDGAHVREEVNARIVRLEEQADEYRAAIKAYDAQSHCLTPGEEASLFPRRSA
jgi:hypothetical protein